MGFDFVPVFDEKELNGYQTWFDRIFATLRAKHALFQSRDDMKIALLQDVRYYHSLIERLQEESDAPCLDEMTIDLSLFRSDTLHFWMP